MRISYRSLFILLTLSFGLLFIGFYSVSNYFQNQNTFSNISSKYIKAKSVERLKFIQNFMRPYPLTLHAIAEDPNFRSFVAEGESRRAVEELFVAIKKSEYSLMEIRYFDMQGNEIIRIEEPSTSPVSMPQKGYITPVKALRNKFSTAYFQDFIGLQEGEIGTSFIELNKEHDKTIEPKQPVVRVALPVFQDHQPKGLLIINIGLKDFLKQLGQSSLYNVELIDNQGRFILHQDVNKSIMGYNFDHSSIIAELGLKQANNILKNDEYLTNQLYSLAIDTVIHTLNSQQKLKIILQPKYKKLSALAKHNTQLIYGLMLLTILLMLPMAVWLARSPDDLVKRLYNKVHFDELTQLPNRTSLFEDMQDNTGKFIVLLKIDNFRQLNNVHGYLLVDELIMALAKRLTSLAKEFDFKTYRLSTNLFAFTLDKEYVDLADILLTVHHRIEGAALIISDEYPFNINITLGASNPEQIKQINQVLIDAETALRTALNNKQDFYILEHTNSLESLYKHNIKILQVIRNALKNNHVHCFYQPIHNNITHKVDKYEVLMRISDEDDIIYPPYAFLEIAKSSKYYHRLTRAMIEQSFEFFSTKEYEFSINISFEDIEQPNFLDFLTQNIEKYKVCHLLVVEILESESLGNYDSICAFVKAIKLMGCKVAIDDFGSGYSSFEHILRLSEYIDYIKIDGSLVKHIVQDATSYRVVKNIKAFCDELGIKSIAEFVADEAIQNEIQALGIHYSQGYFFGKPCNELLEKK
jgi:diguanylate cyclase (GGDEF)-like protein